MFVRYEDSKEYSRDLVKAAQSKSNSFPVTEEAEFEIAEGKLAIDAAMDEFLRTEKEGKWLAIYSGRKLGKPLPNGKILFIPESVVSVYNFDQVLSQRKGIQTVQNAFYAPKTTSINNYQINKDENTEKETMSEEESLKLTKSEKKHWLRKVWLPGMIGVALVGVGIAYASVQANNSLVQNQYTMPPISQQASGGTIGSMNNPSGSSSSGSGGGSSSTAPSSTTQPASQPQSSTPAQSQSSNNGGSQPNSTTTTAPAASSGSTNSAPTSSSQPTVQNVNWSKIESNASPSVVKVVKVTSLTSYVTGSGFFVYGDYVFTDYHVVKEAGMFLHVDIAGTMYPATLVGYNTAYDMALLKTGGFHFPLIGTVNEPALPGGSNGDAVGEAMIYEGYPLGKGLSISQPHVITGINKNIDTTEGGVVQGEFTFTGGAIPGDSGGPVLDANGHVLGAIDNSQTATSPSTYGQQGVCGAVGINAIDGFLQSALPNDLAGLQQNGY